MLLGFVLQLIAVLRPMIEEAATGLIAAALLFTMLIIYVSD